MLLTIIERAQRIDIGTTMGVDAGKLRNAMDPR